MKYREILEQQIEETNRKHMYRDVMSVHEKKINGMDLTGYENMDANLYSKVVGTREPLSNLNPIKSIKDVHVMPNNDLIRKINAPELAMKRYKQQVPDYTSSGRLLEMAIKNMKDPNVDYMRHNTYNRIYGHAKEPALVNKSFEVRSSSFFPSSVLQEKPLVLAGRAQMPTPSKENGLGRKSTDYGRLGPGRHYNNFMHVNVMNPNRPRPY